MLSGFKINTSNGLVGVTVKSVSVVRLGSYALYALAILVYEAGVTLIPVPDAVYVTVTLINCSNVTVRF